MKFVRSLAFACFAAAAAPASAITYASAHPDLYFRSVALEADARGDSHAALAAFVRSARYADKVSQLAIAAMHFSGDGVARDRALAYAWADLAAERGYPDFVAVREHIWAALDESERRDAVERGRALYAAFGDAVAKPRLERLLVRGRLSMTGTRTGYQGGSLETADFSNRERLGTAAYFDGPQPRPTGVAVDTDRPLAAFMPGSEYWAPRNWRPREYWAAQDARYGRGGTVTVEALLPAK